MNKKGKLERDLMLVLTGDLYKKPKIKFPDKVDWVSFFRMAYYNKVSNYCAKKLLENNYFDFDHETAQRVTRWKNFGDKELVKLCRTLRMINAILGEGSYLLLKTYKTCPYITHDVDILVKDLKEAQELFVSNQFDPLQHCVVGKYRSAPLSKKGFLLVEPHGKVSWGSLVFIDDGVLWSGSREVAINDVKVHIPSVEGDMLCFLAHINFQTYDITLGDLLYLFKLASKADWDLMSRQAQKHRWLVAFNETIMTLNSIHQMLYEEPLNRAYGSIKPCSPNDFELPFLLSFPHVTRALMEKGVLNLAKLASYYSDVLRRKHWGFYNAYDKVIVEKLAEYYTKYVFY